MHTVWFPPDIQPARAGVYQRDYGDDIGPPIIQFCWFDGLNWYAGCDSSEWAVSEVCPSNVPAPWRGLTLDEFCLRHKAIQADLQRRIMDATP